MAKHLIRQNSERLFRLALLFARFLVKYIPVRFSAAVGAGLGYFCSFIFRREMEIAVEQIKLIARLNPEKAGNNFFQFPDKGARSVFAHVGRVAMESLAIPKILQNTQCSIESVGEERVVELLRANEGALCLSGHIGCFELLAAYYAALGVPLSVIGRYPNVSALGTVLVEMRHTYGVTVLWREEGLGSRKLVNSLRSGEFLAALIDQDTKLDSHFMNFLGLPAAYPSGIIRLASRLKRPILSSFIVRISPSQHRIITQEISYDPNSAEVEEEVLQTFNQHLESIIWEYPDQWIWWHKRWRRQPGIDYRSQRSLLPGTKQYVKWIRSQG